MLRTRCPVNHCTLLQPSPPPPPRRQVQTFIKAPESISALVSGCDILLLLFALQTALGCLAMLQGQLLQLVFSSVAGSIQLIEVFAPPLAGFGGAS